MAAFTKPIIASFGLTYKGLPSSVFYTVVSSTGSSLVARTNTGVTEILDNSSNSTGTYLVNAFLDNTWGSVYVRWDIVGYPGIVSVEGLDLTAIDKLNYNILSVSSSGLTSIADAVLDRDLTLGTNTNNNNMRSLSRFLRHATFDPISGIVTVYQEDGVTIAFHGTVTQATLTQGVTGVNT